MKRIGKTRIFPLVMSALLVLNMLPGDFLRQTIPKARAAEKINISLDASSHSIFNDTDGDGWGEFQGFGTSLCWWANRVGYDNTLTDAAVTAFYDAEKGLGLKIGRYNIGGGDEPGHNHITRSDSVVPGYATDVTKITTEEEAAGFDQYDIECGYAWNYDWDADKNQLNVLLKAAEKAGDGFLAEAFSNSPPYFMTNSGCSSGGENGSDNIRSDSYQAFVKYLTDVTGHLIAEGYDISSITGMNEPSNGWTALSNKQEGCKIDAGENVSKLIVALSNRLKETNLDDLILSGCDYGGTSDTKTYYTKISEDAKALIERLDTHCYSFSKSSGTFTRETAESEGKNLWMSEVDGAYQAGENAGEMSAALGLSKNMSSQLNVLMPSAWILWDAIDIHIDAKNPFDTNDMSATYCSDLDKNGFWGIAVANHNDQSVHLTKKYYGYGQYSRFIKPGSTLLSSASDNNRISVTAAYDSQSKETVLVLTNMTGGTQSCEVDLSSLPELPADADTGAVRTSGTMNEGENWANVTDFSNIALDLKQKKLSAYLLANSITTFVIGSGASENIRKNYELTKITTMQEPTETLEPTSAPDVTQTPAVTPAPDVTRTPVATKPTPDSESKIAVSKTTIKKVTQKGKGRIQISWKKVAKADGYQIQLAKNKSFSKGKKSYYVSGNKKWKKKITKLKKGRYYIRVRAYIKNSRGKRVYGKCKKIIRKNIK